MTQEDIINSFKVQLEIPLEIKKEDIASQGYDTVTVDEVWELLLKRVKRSKYEEIHLHLLVDELFSIKANDYMSFITMKAWSGK
ncbi:MAG: post-transcriptional regulator family protein [Bacillales bacterium]|nr:post-transcriptional regulator family protein [Bacillales bacterium]